MDNTYLADRQKIDGYARLAIDQMLRDSDMSINGAVHKVTGSTIFSEFFVFQEVERFNQIVARVRLMIAGQ